jgi:hypothetical protein
MRDFFTSSLAVLVTVTLIGSILSIVIPLQQQASAFEIKDFKKLTHEFEKNVISGQWNPGDSPPIRELVDAYGLDVMRIFLDGPDTIPGALILYQEGIFTLFEHSPSGHKPVLNDHIKEFRQLTHAFEKAVIGLTQPPERETPA